MKINIQKNLKELGFNDNETKVYLSLTKLGESSSANIAKKADLPRTTTISILEKLHKNNFVSTHKYKGTTYYWIESPRTIKESFLNKVKIADELNTLLTDLYRTEASFPYSVTYDTKSGIKNFIEKIIIKQKIGSTIFTIDSPTQGNYSKIYSDEFRQTLRDLKKKKNIITKTLVPHNTFKKIDNSKIINQNIIIKELPPTINFPASLWILDDLIVFFSGNPPFITAIKHPLIYQSIKSLNNYLWEQAVEVD